MARASVEGQRRVRFQMKADKGRDVYVAGSFNKWNPKQHKMKYSEGVYSKTILLPKGSHEYKFVVDDIWCVDPECKDWVRNGIGSLNSVVSVS